MKIFEAAFLQLADERKTISAFDLADLLDAVLPNGEKLGFNFIALMQHSFAIVNIQFRHS